MAEEDHEFKSTKQVLELIGLTHEDIEAFFHMTGRGPVMTGEIALLIDVPEDQAAQIAKNLLAKGLVREIPGKNPFYIALPPYTALLNQIQQFKKVVQNIQEATPKALQAKFQQIEEQSAKLGQLKEYKSYIDMMKTNLPAQIKSQFSRMEKELENVKQFQEIRSFILNLREIVPEEIIKEFSAVEERLDKIKSEISIAFEKQFRIGALKSMAEKIVGKIVSQEFSDLTDYFREKFVAAIQNTLDSVTDQLASISDAAGEMSTDLSGTLSDIESGLQETLENLNVRISSVYEDIDKGIDELKSMFQREIYKTLEEDIMTNIINQLDLSEKTMTEFWERSKKASMLSFKDVWFVRSVEGMKAQINDTTTRLKARLHIVTPKLEDIDLVALRNVKKHMNVRISTDFDVSDPRDQAKLSEILKYPNINIRLFNRENVYAINRDFEEVVLCAASTNEFGGIEIAGMGSIIEEHVKLLAVVIEDIWIQSKKIGDDELRYSIGAPASQPIPISQPSFTVPKPIQPQVQPVTPSQPTQLQPTSSLNDLKVEVEPLKQKPMIPSEQVVPQPTALPTQPSQEVPSTIENSDASISELFDIVINNLDKKLGTEISQDIETIRNRITEEIGYSSILNQMSIAIATLKTVPKLLSSFEIEDTKNKINFWRKKANI